MTVRKRLPDGQVDGVDLSEGMLAKARAKAALNKQNPKLTKLELAFYNALKNEIHQHQP